MNYKYWTYLKKLMVTKSNYTDFLNSVVYLSPLGNYSSFDVATLPYRDMINYKVVKSIPNAYCTALGSTSAKYRTVYLNSPTRSTYYHELGHVLMLENHLAQANESDTRYLINEIVAECFSYYLSLLDRKSTSAKPFSAYIKQAYATISKRKKISSLICAAKKLDKLVGIFEQKLKTKGSEKL